MKTYGTGETGLKLLLFSEICNITEFLVEILIFLAHSLSVVDVLFIISSESNLIY